MCLGVPKSLTKKVRGHQTRKSPPRRARVSEVLMASGQSQPFIPLPQNLFDSIKSEPFSIPEDDGNDLTHTFFNPDREGWLLKLGEIRGVATLAHT